MKYRAVIIGLGNIGLGYDLTSEAREILSHTKALSLHPHFELIGGVDPDAQRRSQFENFTKVGAHDDIKKLSALAPIDVVVLAVPTHAHLAACRSAMELSPKLIVLEKPLALSHGEAQEIIELSHRHHIPIIVNYMRRFDPAYKELGARIRAGEFGAVVAVQGIYSRGLMNNASHLLSLLVDWFDVPSAANLLAVRRYHEDIREHDVDFSLTYRGHTAVFQAADHHSVRCMEMRMLFTKARIEIREFGRHIAIIPACTAASGAIEYKGNLACSQPEMWRYQWHVYNDVAARLANPALEENSLENAKGTMQICDMVTRDLETFR